MKCAHCPVELGLHCPGEDAARLCQLTDAAKPDYRRGYVESIMAVAAAASGLPALGPSVKTGPVSDWQQTTGSVPLPGSLELVRRMRACTYRSVDAGCGCGGGRCALRSGSLVSYVECFECIRQNAARLDKPQSED